jgi:hypothetical protein
LCAQSLSTRWEKRRQRDREKTLRGVHSRHWRRRLQEGPPS